MKKIRVIIIIAVLVVVVNGCGLQVHREGLIDFNEVKSQLVNCSRYWIIIPQTGITDAIAQQATQNFKNAAAAGVSLVVRWVYDPEEPNNLNQIQADVTRASALMSGQKAIYATQAGFLGCCGWSEWHDSPYTPGTDHGIGGDVEKAKRIVVDGLKSSGIPVQLRYPRDHANYFSNDTSIGLYDDCILAQGPGGADSGTFDKGSRIWADNDLQAAMNWAKTKMLGPVGGESCEDAGKAPQCTDVYGWANEFRQSYYNTDYPSTIHDAMERYRHGGDACISTLISIFYNNTKPGPPSPPTPPTNYGCWAPDQCAWDTCIYDPVCGPDNCKKSAGDQVCNMLRVQDCKGTWSPGPQDPCHNSLVVG